MKELTIDEQSAQFEIAFRFIESDATDIVSKLDQIDVFANYLFLPKDNDYIDGEINEYSPVFMFIEKMIDDNKNCRQIVIEELEVREDYKILTLVIEPVSREVEAIIQNLNIF